MSHRYKFGFFMLQKKVRINALQGYKFWVFGVTKKKLKINVSQWVQFWVFCGFFLHKKSILQTVEIKISIFKQQIPTQQCSIIITKIHSCISRYTKVTLCRKTNCIYNNNHLLNPFRTKALETKKKIQFQHNRIPLMIFFLDPPPKFCLSQERSTSQCKHSFSSMSTPQIKGEGKRHFNL